MSEWMGTTLGELLARTEGFIRTGPFGSQLHANEYTEAPSGIPVVMPKDMTGGRVDRVSVARVDAFVAKRLEHHKLEAGDIVLARRGDVGRYARIAADEVGYLCGTGCMRVHAGKRGDLLSPAFLAHSFANPTVRAWLQAQAVGSTMPNLNAKIVSGIPLQIPGVAIQGRIAAVLSGLDELIAINERRIELLERTARSLYREWFVRFRFPGHEDATFVDSELGPIPEGWPLVPMSQVVDINPRRKPERGPFKRFTMAALDERHGATFPDQRADRVSGSRFQNGDVLLARITPCLQNGKTALMAGLEIGEIATGSTEFIVLASQGLGSAFVYCLARSTALRDRAIQSMTGASGRQRVRNECFDDFLIPVPPRAMAEEFQRKSGALLQAAFEAAAANRRIASTRDLLLPRLVTGRLDLDNIDLGNLLPAEVA